LFTLFSTPISQARIGVYSLETGEQEVLIEGGIFGRYVPTGHLVYVRAGTLMAVPFDLAHLEVTGPPAPVLDEDVAVFSQNGLALFSFSADGSLAYVPASVLNVESMLLRVDRTGSEEPLIENPRRFYGPRLSPNGQRLAVTIDQENNRDIWVYELAQGTQSRLTFGEANEFVPLWTSDGKRVIYTSERPLFDLYWRVADGSTPEEVLLTSDYDKSPNSISPDGKVLAYSENNPDTGQDIWLLPLEDEKELTLFLGTPFNETYAAFSPNGRWLAYRSNESGQNQVYVRPYPRSEGKWPVSTDGGTEPVWSPDGRELFYRNEDQMMVVSVETEPSFTAGKPRLLFEGLFQFNPGNVGSPNYDISADGQRFLMIKEAEGGTAQINVVLNWFEELKRLVPTGN
jgi:serine/threonine-protein kinase